MFLKEDERVQGNVNVGIAENVRVHRMKSNLKIDWKI